MGPCGGTVCFETSGNKWDRKYKDWYCGNSPQCRDILLLSTLTLNYLLFWWPQFLQSQSDSLHDTQPPHTFSLTEKLAASEFLELVCPVTSYRSYHRWSLSFIAKTLLYFFWPEFPNNPVILGPGYFVSNEKSFFDKATRDKLWIILIADDSPLTIKEKLTVTKKVSFEKDWIF